MGRELVDEVLNIGNVLDTIYPNFPAYTICKDAKKNYKSTLTQKQAYWVKQVLDTYLTETS